LWSNIERTRAGRSVADAKRAGTFAATGDATVLDRFLHFFPVPDPGAPRGRA
jgi:hypothetical protein